MPNSQHNFTEAEPEFEFRIHELVPDREVQLIIYDDGGRRARLAAATLARVGYQHVALLGGGLSAWQSEGWPTATGVNVPSKAFGERVYHERNIPDLAPEELKSLQDRSTDLVVLDVRTPEEYGRFCIPGGINVPGGDLILWAEALKQRNAANCGRKLRRAHAQYHWRRSAAPPRRTQRPGAEKWNHGMGARWFRVGQKN